MSDFGAIATNSLRPIFERLGENGSADSLKIASGEAWAVTRAETRTGRSYDYGGQQIEVTQTVVGSSAEFAERYSGTEQSYLGKTATLAGDTYRIAAIEVGAAFTTIQLGGEEEAL